MKNQVTILILIIFSLNAFANTNPIWGKTGHRVVGAIAEKHLDSTAKQHVKMLLNQQSLALVSTFADEIKFDDRYDQFKPWHYLNMPLDAEYETSKKNPEGDLVVGINYCKTVLADKQATNEHKLFYLKFLIHLIGDLHQPFHLGLKSDRGGNDIKVKWFGRQTNMHSVWDSKMINSYLMSYSELAENTHHLSPSEINDIKKGDVLDWVDETHELTKILYADVNKGDSLGSAYLFKYLDVAQRQMQKAGIRLAKILNELFG